MLAAYGLVFLVAFGIRAAVAAGTGDLPVVRSPELDSGQYLAWAGWIAAGNYAWPQPTIQGPGYPFFLAVLLWLAGGSLTTVALLQGTLGAVSCVITAALGTRWFGSSAGLAAGLLQAVQGPLAFVETSLYCEGLLIFCMLASVYVFTARRTTSMGLLASGVLLGAAAIVRATALMLTPVFLGIVVAESASWRAGVHRAGTLALGAAMLVLPVAAKNAREPFGSFQLQGFAGLNFYIGNSPNGSGTATFRLGSGWENLWGEASRAGALSAASQDRYYVRKTVAEIGRDVWGWMRLLAVKAVWSVQADEIRDSLSFHFFAQAVPVLRWLPGFGLLLPLAAAGAVVLIGRRQAPPELIWWLVAAWISIVLLVVGLRYRLPIVPPVALVAGFGAVSIVEAFRQAWRSSRTGEAPSLPPRTIVVVFQLAAALVAGVVVSHLWRHAPSHALSEEWAMTGSALNSERRLGEAESAYRRALALDERSALAWKGLGIVLYNANRLEEARDAHQRALAIDPGFADAYLRLAFVESRLGRLDAALALLRKAAAILPYDVPIRRALGQHLFATGDYRAAIPEFEWVLSRSPADEPVSGMLAAARRRLR
jgi:4-amino-4-deoxy-L-arabinose transferase-like glycosyltransferase